MKTLSFLSATGALLLALASSAKATTYPDLQYNVTLNLAPLAAGTGAPYSLDFQLAPGSDNITNTVTLSNFSFTGGSIPTTPDYTYGGESGSLATSLVLTNSNSLDNEYAAAIASGVTQITFHVDQTPNSETVTSGTPVPDQFNVSIFDTNGNNVPTSDPSGANTLVTSDFGPEATVNQYTITATPEPNSAALSFLAAGIMLGLVLLRRRSA